MTITPTIYVVTYTPPGDDYYEDGGYDPTEVRLVTTNLEEAASLTGNDSFYDIQTWKDGVQGEDVKYPYLSQVAETKNTPTREHLIRLIAQHQNSHHAGNPEALADTILHQLLTEEWMVADITQDGSIDGGSIYEDENAEADARAYYAKVSTYVHTQPKLIHRNVTGWEEATLPE